MKNEGVKVGIIESSNARLQHIRSQLRVMREVNVVIPIQHDEHYYFAPDELRQLDVVIIDSDGLKLKACVYSELIRRDFPQLKILWSFKHNDPDNFFHARKLGANDWIQHDIGLKELQTTFAKMNIGLSNYGKTRGVKKRKSISKVFFGF